MDELVKSLEEVTDREMKRLEVAYPTLTEEEQRAIRWKLLEYLCDLTVRMSDLLSPSASNDSIVATWRRKIDRL
jgi:hypothetical protein